MSSLESVIRDAVADAVAPLVDQVAQLRAQLAQHSAPADEVGGINKLAAWLGTTPSGAKSLVHRSPDLAALAARVGRVRRWAKRDVDAWLQQRRMRSAPKLRAVGGPR